EPDKNVQHKLWQQFAGHSLHFKCADIHRVRHERALLPSALVDKRPYDGPHVRQRIVREAITEGLLTTDRLSPRQVQAIRLRTDESLASCDARVSRRQTRPARHTTPERAIWAASQPAQSWWPG